MTAGSKVYGDLPSVPSSATVKGLFNRDALGSVLDDKQHLQLLQEW